MMLLQNELDYKVCDYPDNKLIKISNFFFKFFVLV